MSGTRHWAARMGRAGLYVLSLGAFSAPAAASAGLVLVTVAFPFAVTDWRALLREPVTLVVLFCILYLVALTTVLSFVPPSDVGVHWSELMDWIRLSLFIPGAYFLNRNSPYLGRFLLLCVLGLVLGVLWRMDWDLVLRSPWDYVIRSRDGYGFPALGFALFSGTALLGMALLRQRWWAGSPLRIALWAICFLLLLQGFIITQARGGWLSLLVAAGVAFLLFLRHDRRPTRSNGTRLLVFAAAAILVGAFLTTQGDLIVSRLLLEAPAVRDILEGRQLEAGSSSVALRWHAQVFGLETWLQRPLMGWGPGTSRDLMAASGSTLLHYDPGEVLKHLHNTYLELLVQSGLIGLLLAGLLMVVLLRGLVLAYRAGRLEADLYVFLLSSFVLLLLWSLFDYRAIHQDWRTYWVLLAGTVFSFSLGNDAPLQIRERGAADLS